MDMMPCHFNLLEFPFLNKGDHYAIEILALVQICRSHGKTNGKICLDSLESNRYPVPSHACLFEIQWNLFASKCARMIFITEVHLIWDLNLVQSPLFTVEQLVYIYLNLI